MRSVAELPGMTWTERVHPRFAEIQPSEVLVSLVQHYSLRRLRDRRIRGADEAPLRYIHEQIEKIADKKDFLFMQIGAHNGTYDDDFRQYLERYPWRAILIEPQDEPFNQLAKLYDGRSNTSTIQVAVAAEPSYIHLWKATRCGDMEFGTAIASTDIEQVRREIKRCLGKKALKNTVIELELVPATTLDELLSARAMVEDIDLFVCDTEGQDPAIVNQLLDIGGLPLAIQYEHFHAEPQEVAALDTRLTGMGYGLTKTHKDTFATQESSSRSLCL